MLRVNNNNKLRSEEWIRTGIDSLIVNVIKTKKNNINFSYIFNKKF